MKTLGNIIWVIFGGLHIALEYFIAGLILMITIIGIPFGLQSLKLGMLAIWPFGTKVKWKPSQPLPTCKAGSFTFWERGCIAREQERET